MTKILLGVVTAALWFALSQAANAERVCKQVCDNGSCVSRCVENEDTTIIEHRDRDSGSEMRAPDVHVDIGR